MGGRCLRGTHSPATVISRRIVSLDNVSPWRSRSFSQAKRCSFSVGRQAIVAGAAALAGHKPGWTFLSVTLHQSSELPFGDLQPFGSHTWPQLSIHDIAGRPPLHSTGGPAGTTMGASGGHLYFARTGHYNLAPTYVV
ncbi:hypothethical protein [Ralstonia solanacearum PSI07]|nr:hypothethical protein [Ralstonia solanacearum PSI07]